MKSFLTRNILLLSLVSLLTDAASEMLYPVLPIYLVHLGYGVLAIGIIEGIAEAVSGVNKVFFGHISDKIGKRNLFVNIGYGLSAFVKPAMGLFPHFGAIFALRFLDRIGKGIRTAPRDAILASESDSKVRGRVFGFHRSMDTVGAMIGPIISVFFLYFYPSAYSKLFLLALIPGIFALSLTFLLTKEKKVESSVAKPKHSIKSFLAFWGRSHSSYRKLVIGFLLLALLNSSNMFLLIRAKEVGLSDIFVLSSYIIYNLVFALFAFPLGYISDKFSFKWVYISGLLIFSLTYSLFAFGITPLFLLLVFGLYGIFAAVDEGVSKAWLSLHIPTEHRATGLGLSLTLNSLGFLIASILTGLLWQNFGPQLTFTLISLGSLALVAYFLSFKEQPIH